MTQEYGTAPASQLWFSEGSKPPDSGRACISIMTSSRRPIADGYLIAHVFRLSRGEAQALFPAGKVFVSGRLCESPGYTPRPGDIISVRGFGRMKYVGIESLSKKGKENTVSELFV